jgi:hypothetical protein
MAIYLVGFASPMIIWQGGDNGTTFLMANNDRKPYRYRGSPARILMIHNADFPLPDFI